MLRTLKVENYVLIGELSLTLDDGLNIITGQTGAGKSILLGALNLLLGAKNEAGALLDPTKNCFIEGLFELEGLDLKPFFEANDLDYAAQTLITRQITPSGKSRAFVNDTPVQLGVLKELGARLLDIHSQHQNLLLGQESFRLDALDALSDNAALRTTYAEAFDRYTVARRALLQLEAQVAATRQDEQWLRHQVDELSAAALKTGEQAEIEADLRILENAEAIGQTLSELGQTLDAEQTGVLTTLKAGENALQHLSAHYPWAGQTAERLHSVLAELKDIAAEAVAETERVQADPERLQKCTARLDQIFSLMAKHRARDLEELLRIQADLTVRLNRIDHSEETLREARQAVQTAEKEAEQLAASLHESRVKAAPVFAERLQNGLKKLGMTEARFSVELLATELTGRGADAVEYLFSANPKLAPQPVQKTASGGELSRIMLCIKALIASHKHLPTILFDEIDTGVSGHIADAMGGILAALSRDMQVVCITHLPQVASKGRTHFSVYKDAAGTHIRPLDPARRREEIASMLSGHTVTEAALRQADILLNTSKP